MPDGHTYIHIKRNGLIFAASTVRNISPNTVLEVMSMICADIYMCVCVCCDRERERDHCVTRFHKSCCCGCEIQTCIYIHPALFDSFILVFLLYFSQH
jgi:hypothetical protein